jgi:hypothetical protein
MNIANLHQVIFAVSIIITASILNSILTANNIQTVLAEQKGQLPIQGSPGPNCSILTQDGRWIYNPCPTPPPPVLDTTKTKSLLSNDGGIDEGPIQTSPSSSTNSMQSTN